MKHNGLTFLTKWFNKTIIILFTGWMPLILLGALNDQNLNPWGLTPLILKLVITGIIMYLVIFKTPLKHWVVRYRFWLVSLLTITALFGNLCWYLTYPRQLDLMLEQFINL